MIVRELRNRLAGKCRTGQEVVVRFVTRRAGRRRAGCQPRSVTVGAVPGQPGAEPRGATGTVGGTPASTPGTVDTMPEGTANESSRHAGRQKGSATPRRRPPPTAPRWCPERCRAGPPAPSAADALPVQATSAPGRRRRQPTRGAGRCHRIGRARSGAPGRRRSRRVGHVAARRDGGRLRRAVRPGPDAGREQLGGQRGEFGFADGQFAFGVYRPVLTCTHGTGPRRRRRARRARHR